MTVAIAAAAAVGLGILFVVLGLARPRKPSLAEALKDTDIEAAAEESGLPTGFAGELARAGMTLTPGGFLLRLAVAAVGAGAVAGLLFGQVAGAVLALATAAGFRIAVHVRAGRWLDRFEDELPEALDLLAGSLEAGSSLPQAMELVAAEGSPPLNEELERVLADNRLGASLVEALEAAASRVGSQDFAWCVRAIRVQQEFGASLADLMRTLAEFMRWRQEIRGEVRSLTAEGRISSYILIGLPFAVAAFVAVVNPGYLSLLVTTPLGWIMTITAAALMAVGIVWMRRIVKVEV